MHWHIKNKEKDSSRWPGHVYQVFLPRSLKPCARSTGSEQAVIFLRVVLSVSDNRITTGKRGTHYESRKYRNSYLPCNFSSYPSLQCPFNRVRAVALRDVGDVIRFYACRRWAVRRFNRAFTSSPHSSRDFKVHSRLVLKRVCLSQTLSCSRLVFCAFLFTRWNVCRHLSLAVSCCLLHTSRPMKECKKAVSVLFSASKKSKNMHSWGLQFPRTFQSQLVRIWRKGAELVHEMERCNQSPRFLSCRINSAKVDWREISFLEAVNESSNVETDCEDSIWANLNVKQSRPSYLLTQGLIPTFACHTFLKKSLNIAITMSTGIIYFIVRASRRANIR